MYTVKSLVNNKTYRIIIEIVGEPKREKFRALIVSGMHLCFVTDYYPDVQTAQDETIKELLKYYKD